MVFKGLNPRGNEGPGLRSGFSGIKLAVAQSFLKEIGGKATGVWGTN